jgi:hypothetical protein
LIGFYSKYQNRLSGFKSVTDFRKIKQFISIARAANEETAFAENFRSFVFDDTVDIPHLEIGTARIHRKAGNLVKVLGKLCDDLQSIDAAEFFRRGGALE